jgi:hypothetical protein
MITFTPSGGGSPKEIPRHTDVPWSGYRCVELQDISKCLRRSLSKGALTSDVA